MNRSIAQLGRATKPVVVTLIVWGLSCLLALLPLFPAAAISVTDVPNPQQVDGTWVTDMAEMIDPAVEMQINQTISELEASTGAEMAVVTVPDTQSFASPKAFSTELFNTWGIGKAGEDNGVLFLVSKGDRRTEIETGYGVEGLLSDGKVGNILDTRVTPQFKAGNFGQGILNGTQAMSLVLKGEDFNTVPSGTTAAEQTPVSSSQPVTQPSNQPVTQPSRQHNRSEPPAELSFTKKVLSFLTLVLVTPGVIFAKRWKKRLRHEASQPFKIKPIGTSHLFKMASPWLYMWIITWVGEGSQSNPYQKISLWDFGGRTQWNDQLADRYGWLATHYRNQHFNRQGFILFGLLLIVSLTSIFSFAIFFLEILVVLYWLGYETKMSKQQNGQPHSLLFAILNAFALILTFGFVLLFLGLPTGGLLWMLSPFLLIASLGTSAGLIRLLRISPAVPTIACKTCDGAMQKLSLSDPLLQISAQQQAEINVGSKSCEAWRCQTCAPASDPNNLDASEIRLFFFKRKKKGLKVCKACHTETLEVTTRTTRRATTGHSGRKEITRHCHYCGFHKVKTKTIPRVSSSSSSSSYSGSSGSSSSSSSSSSGSSGGSFGGGSSGGGGAGSSW